MFRLARRLVTLFVLGVIVYLVVTAVQVVSASRRDERPRSDAIVVLGAAQYNGRPSPVLAARLRHARVLYGDKVAPVVVVTGGKGTGDSKSEAAVSADYLIRRGVPDTAILREVAGLNSWQSLASAANELRKRGWSRVVLVSDPFHSARIEAIADELGLEASVSPTRTSPIKGTVEITHFGRETGNVALGRLFGFRRMAGAERIRAKAREHVE